MSEISISNEQPVLTEADPIYPEVQEAFRLEEQVATTTASYKEMVAALEARPEEEYVSPDFWDGVNAAQEVFSRLAESRQRLRLKRVTLQGALKDRVGEIKALSSRARSIPQRDEAAATKKAQAREGLAHAREGAHEPAPTVETLSAAFAAAADAEAIYRDFLQKGAEAQLAVLAAQI